MSAQVAADLRAAADVLERDGWTQGNYHCGGHHCAEGALAIAAGQHVQGPFPEGDFAGQEMGDGWWGLGSDVPWERRDDAERFFAGFLDEPVVEWNDTPGRTADEVIAALRAAADRAEAEQ